MLSYEDGDKKGIYFLLSTTRLKMPLVSHPHGQHLLLHLEIVDVMRLSVMHLPSPSREEFHNRVGEWWIRWQEHHYHLLVKSYIVPNHYMKKHVGSHSHHFHFQEWGHFSSTWIATCSAIAARWPGACGPFMDDVHVISPFFIQVKSFLSHVHKIVRHVIGLQLKPSLCCEH